MTVSSQNQMLHQGDFLREWPTIEDGSVDLILTDPPYGTITRGQPWDIRPDYHVLAWIFHHLLKASGQIVIFGDFQNAWEIHEAFMRYFKYRFSWVWQKPSALPTNRTQPANNIEYILVYKRKRVKTRDVTFNLDELKTIGAPYIRPGGKGQNINPTRGNGGNLPDQFENETGDRFPRSIIRFPNKPYMTKAERTSHPIQKPVAMLEYILKGLSNSGDTVLDPFVGSASTLVACHRTGRKESVLSCVESISRWPGTGWSRKPPRVSWSDVDKARTQALYGPCTAKRPATHAWIYPHLKNGLRRSINVLFRIRIEILERVDTG